MSGYITSFFYKLSGKWYKLRFQNLHFGRNIRIDWKSKLDIRSGSLTIGDNVFLRSDSNGYHVGMPFPTTLLIDKPFAEIIIGNDVNINGAYIHAQKKIEIGSNTLIASGVNIFDSNGHALKSYFRRLDRDEPEEIIIGKNVWIGLNSIILKGTYIGDNSVISAGSVVKGTYPENSLISGNPAKFIRKLNLKVCNNSHI